MMQTKLCFTCHEIKPLTEFNKRAASKDGHNRACKDCSRAYSRKLEGEMRTKARRLRERERRIVEARQ
jgi:hypothetical protein